MERRNPFERLGALSAEDSLGMVASSGAMLAFVADRMPEPLELLSGTEQIRLCAAALGND
jgi:hypothetical protein